MKSGIITTLGVLVLILIVFLLLRHGEPSGTAKSVVSSSTSSNNSSNSTTTPTGTGSVLLGAYTSSFTTLESEVGRTLAIENQGESWGTDWGTDSLRAGDEPNDLKTGVIPMISLKMDGGLKGACAKPQDIIDGRYDNTWVDKNNVSHPGLIQLAQTFASWKTPVMIRFFKEFTDDQLDPCFYGVQDPASNPTLYGPEFVAVWKHVVTIFKQQGATNVQWIWGPSAALFNSSKNGAWKYFYPGSNYVDWISNDAYNKSSTVPETYGSDQSILSWYAVASTLGKPLMQAETGAGFNAALEPNDPMTVWITSATSYIQSNLPAIKAFVWWGDPGNNNVDYTLQGTGLSAFKAMAQNPYFGAKNVNQYFSSTGAP